MKLKYKYLLGVIITNLLFLGLEFVYIGEFGELELLSFLGGQCVIIAFWISVLWMILWMIYDSHNM